MIKKLGNTGLLLILVLALALFGLFRYISNKKGENTFKTALIPKIDSGRLNHIVVYPKMEQKGPKEPWTKPLPYVFTRQGKTWYVSQGDIMSRAEPRGANYLVSQLEQINPDRLGTNDMKDWKQYNVTDTLGTRVVLFYDKDTVIDMMVGRFSYMPQQKQAISYMRLTGQTEVYAVPGYLTMNLANEFDNYRDRKEMPGEVANWKKLTFTYPSDSGFVIMKDSNENWVFGDGSAPDSLAAVKTIKDISEQNYGSFVNKYDSNGKQPLFSVKIEGKGFSPTIIKAFPADTANIYAINSTLNPGSFFSGKKNGMFSKIFQSKSAFFKKEANSKAGKKKVTISKPFDFVITIGGLS